MDRDRIHCRNCDKRCYGEALRVQDFHFHPTCFACKACNAPLARQGFYMHDDDFFCSKDYLEKFGTRCHTCGNFVEGDVISALGHTYHQNCFVCAQCREPFPPGEQVTQEGDDCFCEKCLSSRDAETSARLCKRCQEFVEVGQGLFAMDKIWHVRCFCCCECGKELGSKYIAMYDKQYCEDDFNRQHGLRCELCGEYIAGKVVQAGDSYFHAQCSQCAVCGKHVHEDVDVFVLGSNVWHSECFSQTGSENGVGRKKDVEKEVGNGQVPEIIADQAGQAETKAMPDEDSALEQSAVSSTFSPSSSASGDSAISCSTPTGTSSEAETPATELVLSEDTTTASSSSSSNESSASHDRATEEAQLKAESQLVSSTTSSPSRSRPLSETSTASVSTTLAPGDLDSCPTTPTPTPGVIQRTPSTSSSGSGGRIRPKSIAGVPMRSGSQSLSSSTGSFNWKEMYSVDDTEEDHTPLPKSAAGIKSLAHGVVSPSTNADRHLRRDSKPSHLSGAARDKSVSPTSPTASANLLSLIEEPESSSPPSSREPASKPQSTSPISIDKRTYSLADLQLHESDLLLPKGVDRTRLEEYLTDEGFEEALGMTRDAFSKVQVWRQRELKRKAKLF